MTKKNEPENSSRMSLRAKLKAQTMQAHDKIEQNLVLAHLMSSKLSLESYRFILERYLGFFRPIESQLRALTDWNKKIPHFDERLRTPALIEDLQALGRVQNQIVALPDFQQTAPTNEAEFWGTTYVLEGSTLGGSMMAKKLSGHPFLKNSNSNSDKSAFSLSASNENAALETALGTGRGLNFLSGHREKTGVFWQSYLAALESADLQASLKPDYEEWLQAATRAASETFEKMDLWMGQVRPAGTSD